MSTLWFETALLPTGWSERVRVTLLDGLIAAVRTDVDAEAGDERHGAGLPGLCNVHSHAFQRGMAGLTEHRGPTSDNFWTWRALMYRFLDRLTPDDVQVIAALAYAEMLEAGFTRVGEFHYLHHDPLGGPYDNLAEMAERIVQAAEETGIGLTLLPVYYAQSNFGGTPPTPGQRRFLNDPDRFAQLLEASASLVARADGATLGVAPHSLRAVTEDDLARIVALAPPGGPIHIHAAEQTREVDDCLAWSGARPVEWLLDHAPVDNRWTLIHATHMTQAETDRLAAQGATAGLCPITEANLGDGVFPAQRYLDAGGGFGVGTDSNVLIDPAQELRALEYSQRLTRRARNVLSARERPSTGGHLFARAHAGGGQALRAADDGLAQGSVADIVALDLEHPSLIARPGDQILDGWMFAAGREAVAAVWRKGRQVVSQGRHRSRTEIRRRYRQTMTRLICT